MSIKMSYQNFEEVCKKDVLDNIIYRYRYLVNFFYNNRNQTDIVIVDCSTTSFDSDLVNSFKGFQVSFDDKFRERGNYIVFIDPNKDVIGEYNSAINTNLPSNFKPTHVCILSSEITVIEETYSILQKVNGDLVLVNITEKFNPSNSLNSKIINMYGADKVLPISSYCDKLQEFIKYPSVDFTREFNKYIEEILSLCKGKIIIYGGDYINGSKNIYHMIVTELYLRDKSVRFHVEMEDSEEVAVKISSHIFRPYMMLVEDVIKLCNNFPSVTAEYKESFMLYNVGRNPNLFVKASYVPYSTLDKNDVKFNVFNTKLLNVIPLGTYYNLEHPNLEVAKDNEIKLRKLIHSLYDVLPIESDKIIDVTNLFFFELDGVEYVGYNHNYEFTCDFKSYLVGLPPVKRNIKFENLSQLLFISPFRELSTILTILTSAKLIEGKNFKSIIPINTMRNNSVSLSSHYISNKSDSFEGIPNALFCIGMYSKDCYITRVGLYKRIAEKVGMAKTRKMLDSFGAFNVITNRFLQLTLERD